jgi:prepilin-type processing-associated H-X9-DG protein
VVGSVGVVALLCVGVFAAILFPVFAKAREKARQTSCLSNVRQLQTGMLMYSVDYDDRLPLGRSWSDGLLPYTKNRQLFVCPSHTVATHASYRMNQDAAGAEVGAIADPKDVPALFESGGGWNRPGSVIDFSPRHSGQGNIGFVDGHCKAATSADVAKYDWSVSMISSGVGATAEAPGQAAEE